MIWETPKFAELKMDAEIGSYQDDFQGDREPEFVGSVSSDDAAE